MTLACAKLKQWRVAANLSGVEMAVMFGLSKTAWYRIENGERTVPDALKQAIARRGICDIADFFAPLAATVAA
jgi:transcriptional regulator with XRE-family HTH domain